MDKNLPEHISTRIIGQRELVVDGVPFQWWAVGENPALVTVRAPLFGTLTEFTHGDVAEFAAELAKKLLTQPVSSARKDPKPARTRPNWSALDKPGWFEPGNTDFSSTVF
jgi:hypothetical protein